MILTQQHKAILFRLIAFLIPICAVGGYSVYRMWFYDDWSFWLMVALPLCGNIIIACWIYLKASEYKEVNRQFK